jgi:L-ascorbate metabolism protein UlaG (beta-lactamase superfamily)
MRFRWLGEACVEIKGQHHLLIDPNYTVPPDPGIDLILVTHEHDDHFREEAKDLGAPLWAPRSAVETFDLEATIVAPGRRDGEIEVVPSFCYGSEESVGYLIHGDARLLHLGDSFRSPQVTADVLFVPIFADYHNEILEAAETCGAQRVYPIHYDPQEKPELALQLVEKLEARGIEAGTLSVGEWVEVSAS